MPEVRALLAAVKHANHHLLLSTLWHTGARVSEAIALTVKSFTIEGDGSYVSLKTLKSRGRPHNGIVSPAARMVPIRNAVYLRERLH